MFLDPDGDANDMLRCAMDQLRQEQFALEREMHQVSSHPVTFAPTVSRPAMDQCNWPHASSIIVQEQQQPERQREQLYQSTPRATRASAETAASAAADGDICSAATQPVPSVHAQLREFQRLRHKYEARARAAMQRYLHSVQDYTGYEAKRQQRLAHPQPFSFAARELMKPASRAAERAAQERQRREEELEAAVHTSFVATPVPASTFMNKYALMVEEWRERGKAVRLRARDRARAVRARSAFARLSAHALRHTRQQWREECGAQSGDRHASRHRTGSHSYENAYDEDGDVGGMPGGAYRSATHRDRNKCSSVRTNTFDSSNRGDSNNSHAKCDGASLPRRAVHEIPLEVRMRLWPAVEEHEQVRKERLKKRAQEQRQRMDVEARRVLPIVLSPTPMRVPEFHAQFDYRTLLHNVYNSSSNGDNVAEGATTSAAAANTIPAAGTVTTAAGGGGAGNTTTTASSALLEATPACTSVPSSHKNDNSNNRNSTAVIGRSISPVTYAHAERTTSAQPSYMSRMSSAEARFVPDVRPGVPDYELIWSQEAKCMHARKQRQATTVPRPFALSQPRGGGSGAGNGAADSGAASAAAKDYGKDAVRSVVAIAPPKSNAAQKQQQEAFSALPKSSEAHTAAGAAAELVKQSHSRPATRSRSGAGKPVAAPRGTRAHALRTERVYSTYTRAEESRADASNGAMSANTNGNSNTSSHLVKLTNEAEAEAEARRMRQREVARRVAPYLSPTSGSNSHQEQSVEAKVRRLRRGARESDAQARERLAEMRARVAQMPPLFAEPVHVQSLSDARAATEKEIVHMLRNSAGLDKSVIHSLVTGAVRLEGNNTSPSSSATAAAPTIASTSAAPATNATVATTENASSNTSTTVGATSAQTPEGVGSSETETVSSLPATSLVPHAPLHEPKVSVQSSSSRSTSSRSESDSSVSSSRSTSTPPRRQTDGSSAAAVKSPTGSEYSDSFESDSDSD